MREAVPSSRVNLRNLLGLESREVTVPTSSTRERRSVPKRQKVLGSDVGVRD